jgi:hypothetical protein
LDRRQESPTQTEEVTKIQESGCVGGPTSAHNTTKSRKRTYFADLPMELCRQIYDYCLVQTIPIEVNALVRWKHVFSPLAEADAEWARLYAGERSWSSKDMNDLYYFSAGRAQEQSPQWGFDDLWGMDNLGQNKSLLLVSKQISEEAMDVLYSENTFVYHVNGRRRAHLASSSPVSNLSRIRNLRLLLGFWAFYPRYVFDLRYGLQSSVV